MKTRESGMPEEEMWSGFFQPDRILDRLRLRSIHGDVVEFGCGYGTFTIPAAQRSAGIVHALDIEPDMVALTASKAKAAGLRNIRSVVRDFITLKTGLPDNSAAYAMLFNILHAEQPAVLLGESWRVLRTGGLLGIMHWNYDPSTPRGPTMDIRPRPEQCRDWAIEAGFDLLPPGVIDLPPYHYGMVLSKSANRD
jgi:ubiquinone/menaquinone biosynthesis C-methylase UbiE